jgi:hypothetical protein
MNNNDETLLINILNTMYNDNLRQIYNLQDSNIQIRRLLTEFLSIRRPPRPNRTYRRTNLDWNNVNLEYQDQVQNSGNLARESARQATESARQARETANTIRHRNRIETTAQTNEINQLLQQFLDPIEIFPTQTQIENATRVALYRDIVNPNNQTCCPISLVHFNNEDRVSIIRYCGHIFHTEELLHWFRSSCICPVCRYDIRNYNTQNIGLQNQNNIDYNNSINEHSVNDNNNDNNNDDDDDDDDESPINENAASETTITNENTGSENNSQINQDTSGNLLGALTDAVLNSFLNTYAGSSNDFETIFLDVIFDSSNNIIRNPSNTYANNTYRYYTFPYTRRE